MSSRILFVTHLVEIGGPTYSLLLLVRYLKANFNISVLLPKEGALCDFLTQENVPYYVIPGLVVGSIPSIFELIRREKFDLIYGNTPSGCVRNALIAAKFAGKPFIWHLRSMLWNWPWHRGLFLRWADAIVVVSQKCGKSIERFVRPEKINVVYNGVETALFECDSTVARNYLISELNLQSDARCVISVSHIMPRKGHKQAVEVMTRLVNKIPNLHLIIAGGLDYDANYTNEIRTIIREQNLERCIHLVGLRTDIPKLLRGADIFLHTANQDPHPRAVIEAMAAGLPVVAVAVDGVAETVVDKETGYLLEMEDVRGMADAILSLLKDPQRASEMGRRGMERISNQFTASHTARQISQIIEKHLDGKHSGL